MMPFLNPNDRVLVSSLPYFFSKPKIGEMIMFEHNKKNVVKKITKISGDRVQVQGENINDSLKIENIENKQILGKVVYIIKQ
jgi:signal peptidase I